MQRFLWTNCWKPYHCSCDGNIGHGQHDTPQRFPDDLQEQRTALNLVSGKSWAGTTAFSLIQKVLRGIKMALFIMHGRYFQGVCYSWIPLCNLWRGWWKGFPLLEIFSPHFHGSRTYKVHYWSLLHYMPKILLAFRESQLGVRWSGLQIF